MIINDPVSFSDSLDILNLPKNKNKFKKIISLFNVQPQEFSSYINYCLFGHDDIYNEKNTIDFYQYIIDLSSKENLILIKEKRFNRNLSSNYSSYISKLSLKKNVIFYNQSISPYKLINLSDIVISFPFSSTALFANARNKKSVYFDPTNKLSQKDSPFGIKIYNKNNLVTLNNIIN